MEKNIYLIGLNHKTAPIDVRERFALTDLDSFEEELLSKCPVHEVMALSTCNRVEIITVCGGNSEVSQRVLEYWAQACGGDLKYLEPHVYEYNGIDAVRHLFSVASSLDSMVMGEPQILGQLKDSYRTAVKKGVAKTVVNRLLHKSFSVAKRVRTQTALASSAVSISYAAVELAKKIFGELAGKRAMLVGAGEMAELAATHLVNNGVESLLVANRTFARAKELASCMHGEAVSFENLAESLERVDIVISSTGSPTSIIKAKNIKEVLKKRKYQPMFFIDIAVPRDIDPDVNNLDNVYLYDIDDLKEVVEENIANRREEAAKAELIVEAETESFENWINSLELQPTIVDMVKQGEDLAQKELAKTLRRLGSVDDDTKDALETLVLSLSMKILHEPIAFLKRRTQEEGSAERFIHMARRMFNLDDELIPEDAHRNRKSLAGKGSTDCNKKKNGDG